MQEAIASIEGLRFDVEDYLQSQVGAQPLPFPGMDSKKNEKNNYEI